MNSIKYIKFIVYTLILFAVHACGASAMRSNGEKAAKQHQVEVRERGIGMIYIDKVPNSMVMQNGTDTSGFVSLVVGFVDSNAITGASKKAELGKYYQYEMYRDWVMVNGRDSTRPVFYQERVQLSDQKHESVLVFELPAAGADTLVYNDGLNYWGKHIIFLNQ